MPLKYEEKNEKMCPDICSCQNFVVPLHIICVRSRVLTNETNIKITISESRYFAGKKAGYYDLSVIIPPLPQRGNNNPPFSARKGKQIPLSPQKQKNRGIKPLFFLCTPIIAMLTNNLVHGLNTAH